MIRTTLSAIAIALTLSSCAGTGTGSPVVDKSAVTACSGYAVSLSTLADLRAAKKLSDAVVAKVDAAVTVAHPVCSLKIPPALDSATLAAVENSVSTLVTLAKGN